MKQISLFIPLLGTLLLSGCAGTSTEFECNATTSDTCMTMEQANEKAKKLEQSSEAKPVAASLPRLAEGNCQRQDYWPFFAIFNVRYWSLMLSAFRHFIITDWRGVFCQHSRFAFFL